MREVDDPQQPEDDSEPETQDRVERTIDQAEQNLSEQRRKWDAEHFCHLILQTPALNRATPCVTSREICAARPAVTNLAAKRRRDMAPVRHVLTAGQALSESGRNAFSPGISRTTEKQSHSSLMSLFAFTSTSQVGRIRRPSARTLPPGVTRSSTGNWFSALRIAAVSFEPAARTAFKYCVTAL